MEDRFERLWRIVALGVVAAKACLSTISMSSSAGPWTSWVSINLLTSTLILIPLGVCLVRRSRSYETVRVTGLEVASAALGVWALATALWAREPGPAVMYGFEFLSISAAMFVLAQSARGEEVWRTLIGIWIFGLLIGAAQYWIQFDAEIREIMHQRYEQTGSFAAGSIDSRAIPSIYGYVNLFAAMLILLIGTLAGAVWDARKGSRPSLAVLGLALGASLMMLWITHSQAAQAALALAGLVGAGRLLYRLRPNLALIPSVIAAALILVGGLRILYTSRMDIWLSAIKVGLGAPIFGVGAGNFGGHYPSVRTPEALNGPFAFNDYLQVFCEMGIVGLGVLIGFWAIGMRVGAPVEAKIESDNSPSWTAGAGIAAGLLLAWMIGSHHPTFRLPLYTLFGSAAIAVWTGARLPRPGAGARLGLWSAAAGFAAHMAFDFDLYESNLFLTAGLSLLALRLGSSKELRSIRLSRAALLAGGAACLIGFAALLGFWIGPRLRADGLKYTGLRTRNLDAMLEAARLSPGDPEPWIRIASIRLEADNLRSAVEALERAAEIRPHSWSTWFHLGVLRTALGDARAGAAALQRARALHPSDPMIRVRLAEASLALGDRNTARDELLEALRLHLHTRVGWLQLPPDRLQQVRELLATLTRD